MKRLLVCESSISEFKDVVKNFSYIKKEHLPNIFPGETSIQDIFNYLASSLINKHGSLDGSLEFVIGEYTSDSWSYILSVSDTGKQDTGHTRFVPCTRASVANYEKEISFTWNRMRRCQTSVPFEIETILTKSAILNEIYQEVTIKLPNFKYPK